MTARSAHHGTFTVERRYPVYPATVFGAFADEAARAVWMDDPDLGSDSTAAHEFDFRVGGHERFGGLAPDGTSYSYDAVYYDIVPDQRLVYCYEMYSGRARMSVSVATVQFAPDGDGTKLTLTEQGVFLDGIDTPESRQEGTEWLMDNLGKYLAEHADG